VVASSIIGQTPPELSLTLLARSAPVWSVRRAATSVAQCVVDLGDALLEQLPGPPARRLTAAVGGQDLRRRVQAQPE